MDVIQKDKFFVRDIVVFRTLGGEMSGGPTQEATSVKNLVFLIKVQLIPDQAKCLLFSRSLKKKLKKEKKYVIFLIICDQSAEISLPDLV